MATLRVTEFTGAGYGNGRAFGVPSMPAYRTQPVAISSSASTASVSAVTNLVMLDTDAGCYVLFGSSASTTVATATNAMRIPADQYRIVAVTPASRLTVLST